MLIHNEVELTEANEVTSVSDFIQKIKELKDSAEGGSTDLYFRGQKTEYWDIEPSIFREDMISIEHELMQIPLARVPGEFKEFNSMFEIMTKYQHYGMCTRLLDLTTNPLVALYFACEQHGNVSYRSEVGAIEKEPYGAVYYTDLFYSTQAKDQEVAIVSALEKYDLSKENSIKVVLDKLEKEGVITNDDRMRWSSESRAKDFVDVIQKNYMVLPTYTNDRLQRQNGVFLLASMFNVESNAKIEEGIISKSKGSLRNEFSEKCFYIRGENKEAILKELDLYNINEATLFPELEHQLNHIRHVKTSCTQPVDVFSKYHETEDKDYRAKAVCVNYDELNGYIVNHFDMSFRDVIADKDMEPVKNIVIEHFEIDWHCRESSLSKMRRAIMRYYFAQSGGLEKELSRNKAKEIMARLNDMVRAFAAA